MRHVTVSRIIQDLRVFAPTTRGDISRRTGISPALVGQVMERLIEKNLVTDTPGVRKDKTLSFPATGDRFLGVEIERERMVLVVSGLEDAPGEPKVLQDPLGPGYLSNLDALCRPLEEALASTPTIDTVAISVRHTVDRQGVVRYESPANPGEWIQAPLPALLSARLGRPVLFVNKVKALSYGERRRQQRLGKKGASSFLLVSLGTSLGATLVLGGQVVAGERGFAGEIGSMRVPPHGVADDRGQTDTLENTLCAMGLLRRIRHGIYQGMRCAAREAFLDPTLDHHQMRFWSLLRGGWQDGDPAVTRAVTTAATLLGSALSPLEEFCDPERILLTGPALLDQRVFDLVEAAYRETMERRKYRDAVGLTARFSQVTDIALGAMEPAMDAWLERWIVREFGA